MPHHRSSRIDCLGIGWVVHVITTGLYAAVGKHLDFFVTSTEVKVLESDSGWEASIFRDRYAWCRSGFVAFFQATPTNGHGGPTDSKSASGVFVKSEKKKDEGALQGLSPLAKPARVS